MIINDADYLHPDDWYDQLIAQGYTPEYAARRAYDGPLLPDEDWQAEWAFEDSLRDLPSRLEVLYGPN